MQDSSRLGAGLLIQSVGIDCTLVLTSTYPPPEGNLLLDHLLGALIHFVPPGPDPTAESPHLLDAVAEILGSIEARGGRPYFISLGASTPLGTLGYLDAAREIDRQLAALTAADTPYRRRRDERRSSSSLGMR